MARVWIAIAALPLGLGAASAQAPASNAVGECTLVVDPTALRACIESARQSRSAASFDPSAQPAPGGSSGYIDLLPSASRRAGLAVDGKPAKPPAKRALMP